MNRCFLFFPDYPKTIGILLDKQLHCFTGISPSYGNSYDCITGVSLLLISIIAEHLLIVFADQYIFARISLVMAYRLEGSLTRNVSNRCYSVFKDHVEGLFKCLHYICLENGLFSKIRQKIFNFFDFVINGTRWNI